MTKLHKYVNILIILTVVRLLIIAFELPIYTLLIFISVPLLLVLSFIVRLYVKQSWVIYSIPSLLFAGSLGSALWLMFIPEIEQDSFRIEIYFIFSILVLLSSIITMLFLVSVRKVDFKPPRITTKELDYIVSVLLIVLISVKFNKWADTALEINYIVIFIIIVLIGTLLAIFAYLFKIVIRRKVNCITVISIIILVICILFRVVLDETETLLLLSCATLPYVSMVLVRGRRHSV